MCDYWEREHQKHHRQHMFMLNCMIWVAGFFAAGVGAVLLWLVITEVSKR